MICQWIDDSARNSSADALCYGQCIARGGMINSCSLQISLSTQTSQSRTSEYWAYNPSWMVLFNHSDKKSLFHGSAAQCLKAVQGHWALYSYLFAVQHFVRMNWCRHSNLIKLRENAIGPSFSELWIAYSSSGEAAAHLQAATNSQGLQTCSVSHWSATTLQCALLLLLAFFWIFTLAGDCAMSADCEMFEPSRTLQDSISFLIGPSMFKMARLVLYVGFR